MPTAFKQVADNAYALTTTNLSSIGVTSLALPTGQGARFPQPGNGFIVTLWDATTYPSDPSLDPNMEKVVCSARSGDTLTIGATVNAHLATGTMVALLDVASNTTDMQTAINTAETNVTSLFANDVTLQGNISSEATARANADALLLSKANNLSDLASASTARSNLGLGTVATLSSISLTANVSGILPIGNGGTGQNSLTSLPLTTPLITTSILDTNAKTVIGLTATASAVNYINILNNATGLRPAIQAAGSDTNVDLALQAQGSGAIVPLATNLAWSPSISTPTIMQSRNSSVGGQTFTIQAQGGVGSGTDITGGTLSLSSGTSTGGAGSQILLKAYGPSTGVVKTVTLNSGGSGYTVGDTLTVSTGGANATVIVDTAPGGVIATFHIGSGGTGYTISNGQPTTGGTGTNAKFNVTALTGTADTGQQTVVTISNGGANTAFAITPVTGAQLGLSVSGSVTIAGNDVIYAQITPTISQTTKPGGALYGITIRPTSSAASGTGPDLYGAKFNPLLTGNGTVSAVRAFQAIPEISSASTGTITTAYGVDISPFISNASAVIGTLYYVNASLGTLTGSINNVIGFNMAAHTVANLGVIIAVQVGALTAAASNVTGIILGALTSTATGTAKGMTIGNISSATASSGIEIGTVTATAGSSAVTGLLIGNVTTSGSGTVRAIKTGSGDVEFGAQVAILGTSGAATHSLTLGSTATGITLHNQSDQTTNYERFRMYWSSSVATLTTDNGGTGTIRPLVLGSGSGTLIKIDSGGGATITAPKIVLTVGGTTGNYQAGVTATLSASAIVQNLFSLAPTISQSSTAGYTALLVNVTESSTGSGAKLLADFQVGSVSRISIDNVGRLIGRTGTTASSATPTINTDTTRYYNITALAAAITSFTTNLTGTPVDGQTLWIAITDNGTARAITWGTSFEASTVALPTTTVISTRLDVGFIWNTATSKWRCVAVS